MSHPGTQVFQETLTSGLTSIRLLELNEIARLADQGQRRAA